MKKTTNTLIITDTHFPFVHKNALRFVSDVYKEYGCTSVVHLGDLYDEYQFSRYAKDPDAFSALDEIRRASEMSKEWGSVFPKMVITKGNHCTLLEACLRRGGVPPSIMSTTLHEIFGMPKGWEWVPQYQIGDVLMIHGAIAGEYAHVNMVKHNRCSTIIGHTHSTLAVQWMRGPVSLMFGANAGCLIDPEAYAFRYAKDLVRRPVLGCLVLIDNKIPVPIPMEVKR